MQRHSPKRDAILQCIRQTDCHPSAEWVYGQLKPRFPDLSLGTVYRNLALFREQGLIRCLDGAAGESRADGDLRPHAHFSCRVCGRIFDRFDILLPAAPADEQVECTELVFYGVCRDCLQK